ncbi:MAG: TRIC cation channel family protein [Candidatus Bathyarchaeia archaeon]|jgi:uncharacterized membrane protein YeiH
MNFWDLPFFTVTFTTFTIIDLLAASTNAFNGALLCRRASHYRNYTVVGIILMALLGGIGGGVSRDVLLNKIPSAFTNPLYIFLCVVAAYLALLVHYNTGQAFREGLFSFMTAFSLPWYATVGVDAALRAGLPALAAIVIGVIGPTAGRYFIDITSGVTPKHFLKGEWFVGTAVLTSAVYVVCYWSGLDIIPATLISFVVGFSFRLTALFKGWEEPEPKDQPKQPESARKTLGTAIEEELEEAKKKKASGNRESKQ